MATSTETNGTGQGEFKLKQEPIENFRPLRVVVVGAGFSGIAAAIRIPEKLRNVELTVYEKNERVGGVWWLNKYPGVACDIPSHSYQYSFAPNPNWSNLYAPGAEIQQYLEDVATRFGATRFIKLCHEVRHCAWDDQNKLWKIQVQDLTTGTIIDDEANILVTARGQLNEIKWPEILGLHTFSGKVMHSGAWDTEYDFRNKKIAVIGNGSSAIQIIPALQKVEGTELTCFMRSSTWISGAFGDQAMEKLGLDPKNTAFTPEQQKAFAEDPEAFLRFRKVFEDGGNLIHDSTLLGTPMQTAVQALFRGSMQKTLASNPTLAAALIPKFPPGCRRLTPGPGFLESLLQPNITVISHPIASISGSTIITSPPDTTAPSPSEYSGFDVLILATGFHTSVAPPFPIITPTHTLSSHWTPYPQTYLSLATSNFPNLFHLFGPSAAIGFGSLTMILEAEVSYLTKIIRKLQKEDYTSIVPKPSRVRDFHEYCRAYFAKTVYMEECRSWYKRDGEITGLWPGSTLHCLEALRSPRWEDWDFEREEGENALGWLGNGWSVCETGEGDPSWYLNVEEVEIPWGERPEENPRWRARPWSN